MDTTDVQFAMIDFPTLKARLAKSEFRSRFHLSEKEKRYVAEKGLAEIELQARKIISDRLAAAFPVNDGRQTPMRGHAVFIAQHATGCCCRNCLAKWHAIPKGRELQPAEIHAIAAVITGWIAEETADLSGIACTPDLF